MKLRDGFVSNSSSSSFMILKKYLTESQIIKIKNHDTEAAKVNMICYEGEKWEIFEDEDFVRGRTWLDNFEMDKFLTLIKVPSHKIDWSEF